MMNENNQNNIGINSLNQGTLDMDHRTQENNTLH